VSHPDGSEIQRGINHRLWSGAASLGFRKQPLQIITDSHGRPAFDLFRFEPLGSR